VKPKGLILALVILAAVLAGCAQRQIPTSPDAAAPGPSFGRRAALATSGSETVNNFIVRYDGRTFAGGQTTFAYTVSGTGVGPVLNHFVVEIPSCAPALASSAPSGGSVIADPTSGLFGVKWGTSLETSESRAYSITFPGDVPDGLVRVAVKAGEAVGIAVLPGPCQGFFISGTVFVDPDSSGGRDATEPALAEVTVALVDGSGAIETALTDSQGRFSFRRLEGTYTVRVDASTPATDFNEVLAESFSATGPNAISVTVGPDASGADFGFKPRTRKLIADFQTGALTSTSEPGSFWIKAFRAGARGASYGGFDAASLRALLAQIEASGFPDPYQFTDGSELQEALAILTSHSKVPVDVLYRELFVAELNDASGKGLLTNPNLQDVLLSWGESLIIASRSAAVSPIMAGSPIIMGLTDEFELEEASTFFGLLNNSARGGGGTPL